MKGSELCFCHLLDTPTFNPHTVKLILVQAEPPERYTSRNNGCYSRKEHLLLELCGLQEHMVSSLGKYSNIMKAISCIGNLIFVNPGAINNNTPEVPYVHCD